MTLLQVGLLCLLLPGLPGQVYSDAGHPQVINLHPDGPHPPQLEVAAGTAVVWVSHLAPTPLIVVTVVFHEGPQVAQATTAVQGYNSFVLEGHDFLGRLAGNGGKVALRFVIPGTYTYITGQHHPSGTIVVR
jgi:hypothetical protein